jgi:hypothetical protein
VEADVARKIKFYIQIRRRPLPGDTTIRFPTGSSHRNAAGEWVQNYVTRAVLAWPVLFDDRESAEDYMHTCFHFRRIPGRKLSASVERTFVEVPDEQA